MHRLFVFLLTALVSLAAEDSWSKVRELQSGAELRIYKKGAKQPILAKANDLTEDKLLVVVKNEQVAIAKDDIDRIDARPARTSSRVTKETRESISDPNREPSTAAHPREPNAPTTSSSTNFSLGAKPDFELIYRRSPPAPQK